MSTEKEEKILDRLRQLASQRACAIDTLTQPNSLTIGSVHDTRRRCGKPGCYCAKEPGHLQTVLMSVSESRRRCQLVRQDDVKTVRRSVARYKDFRAGLRTIKALDLKALTLLKQLMRLRDTPYK